jgi:hypothetical protein
MDSSDEEQFVEDEDVLCKYGTALTPYEAGKPMEILQIFCRTFIV